MPVTEQKNIYVPAFKIKVNNKKLNPPVAKSIMEVSVTEYLKPPGKFSLMLNDPELTLINAQDGLFTEGSLIEIWIGYVGNTKKLIAGEISALTADFPNSGAATVHVEGFDLMHRLTRGTVYRIFGGPSPDKALSDIEIVKQIAKDAGLKCSVDPIPARTLPRIQNYITNLAFLEELAEKNGYCFWVDGDTLYFKQKRPPKTIRLEWGKTLLSISPRLSTAGLVNTVEVRGWDPVQKQSFSAPTQLSGASAGLSKTGIDQVARGAGGQSKLVVRDIQATSKVEAQAYAEAIIQDRQQAVITGTGTSVGEPDIRAGTLLELGNIGRFEGTYVVEQVTHTIGSSGYTTFFQIYIKELKRKQL